MSSKKLNPFKDFQSDQMQRSSRKIFTAHYACRNAALNLTPVTGTTYGFIFQMINSLIESWGLRLTWFDCNIKVLLVSFELLFWNLLNFVCPKIYLLSVERPTKGNRELTNWRLSHDDAVGLRDRLTAHAYLGTCRRRAKVDAVVDTDSPAS